MKQIDKIIIIVSVIILTYLLLGPFVIVELFNVNFGHKSTISKIMETLSDSRNVEQHRDIVIQYAKERFGEVIFSKLIIMGGYSVNDDIQSYPADLMEFRFFIYLNKKTLECYDNFSEALSRNSKFQQLYSEWVKKQIGCEDENVKIEFYVNDEIFIDFKQIESISDDCSEIFKNIYNCKLRRIYIKNFPNLSLDNFVNYVKNFVNEKYSKLASLSSFTGGFIILAYGYDYDMYANSSQYVKYYGTKDNINNYSIGVFNGGKLDNEVEYCYMDEKKGTYYEDVIIIS